MQLWEQVVAHREHLESNGLLDERRRRNLAGEVFTVASARAKIHLEQAVADDPELRGLLDEVQRRKLDPLTAVREIMEKVFQACGARNIPGTANSGNDDGDRTDRS